MRYLIAIFLSTWMMTASGQPAVEPFMPEVFREMPYVRDIAMSKNGQEIYFTVDDYQHTFGALVVIEKKRKKWSSPRILPFSGQYRDIEPFLANGDERLYFVSNRPYPGETGPKDYDIYYVERRKVNRSWGDPVRLDAPVNSMADEFYPSVSDKGDLYFTAERTGTVGREDIWMAQADGKRFRTPVPVLGRLNTEAYEFNAFVAPDASYIIFTSYRLRDGRNRSDLYISLRQPNGAYGEGILLDGIYSDAIDYCPFVRDGVLYFTSERSAMADHHADRLEFREFMELLKTTPNGLGRIYTVDFNKVLLSIAPERSLLGE